MKRIDINTDKLESYDMNTNLEYEDVLDEMFDCGDYVDNGDAFAGFIGSRASGVDIYGESMEIDYVGVHNEIQMRALANDIVENLCKDETRPFGIDEDGKGDEVVTYDGENEIIYCVCLQPYKYNVCIYFYEKA